MEYRIEEHMHRFACWTAARAVSRGFLGGSNEAIADLINESNLRESLSKTVRDKVKTKDGFDKLHTELKKKLLSQNALLGHGRAAKTIAIYIKTAIIPFEPYSEFSKYAHPPIDSILLSGIQKAGVKDNVLKHPWTQYNEKQYSDVIHFLWASREKLGFEYFWQIEKYWNGYR